MRSKIFIFLNRKILIYLTRLDEFNFFSIYRCKTKVQLFHFVRFDNIATLRVIYKMLNANLRLFANYLQNIEVSLNLIGKHCGTNLINILGTAIYLVF